MAGRRWTPEELDRLHDLWGTTSPRTIARELGRTVPAILVRGSQEGLGRTTPAGSLTLNEAMRALGMSSHPTMRRWIADGLLSASRHTLRGARRPDWIVTEPALAAFLRKHPHLVDRDEVDPAYRQYVPERWVTLVQAFRLGAAFPVLLENGVKAGLIPEARQRGEKGTRWVIPASILPRLIEGRRTMTSDPEHRRLVVAYDRAARTGNVARRKARLTATARATSRGGISGGRAA